MNRLLIGTAVLCASFGVAGAASLNLTYSIAPQGSVFLYNMTLSVDQSTSAWSPGMGWGWITFGDVPNNGTSPLADFTLTSSLPMGPFASLSSSSGGHDGPSWIFDAGFNVTSWVPASATDTLSWSGTSAFNATPGSLQFSELIPSGGATADNFKNMIQAAPEPASFLALGGLIPVFLRKRRARK